MPTRRPYHEIHAQRRDPANVLDHRIRSGEVHADIDALELLARDALALRVDVNIHHQAHFEAPLRRKLRHRFAHLAVAEQGQVYRSCIGGFKGSVTHISPRREQGTANRE